MQVAPTKMPWPANEPRRVCVTNFGETRYMYMCHI